ncbi:MULTISPECIES: copper chaperone PCu(A)C [unclassified Nonomuraea]|uniref:copper chaperone PCu(A)C n=1 Tax=Nonomuraea sp. NPDC003804 TaxID=3154547 RepID=UPI0033A0B42E
MTSRRWIIAAAAFLAAPVLAGCAAGFDANTNQPYAPNEAAALIQDGSYGARGIKIPQAFVLGPDSGAKLAQGGSAPIYLHVVNTNGQADSLVSVAAEVGTVKLAAPIALPSNEGVNTGKPSPQLMIEGLSKPLSGGESVRLALQFANAGSVSVNVPVITRSREFAQYPSAPGATPAPPTPTPTASHTAESGH